MSYGIEVKNKYNTIQISNSKRNLRLIEKTTITYPNYTGNNAYNNRIHFYRPKNNIVAFRTANPEQWCGIVGVPRGVEERPTGDGPVDGNFHYYIIASSGAVIDVYVFAEVPYGPGKWIEVYNYDDGVGKIIFSDSHKEFCVDGIYHGTIPWLSSAQPVDGSILTASTSIDDIVPAVVISRAPYWINEFYDITKISCTAFSFSANSFEFIWKTVMNNGGSNNHPINTQNYEFVIIDVSGV